MSALRVGTGVVSDSCRVPPVTTRTCHCYLCNWTLISVFEFLNSYCCCPSAGPIILSCTSECFLNFSLLQSILFSSAVSQSKPIPSSWEPLLAHILHYRGFSICPMTSLPLYHMFPFFLPSLPPDESLSLKEFTVTFCVHIPSLLYLVKSYSFSQLNSNQSYLSLYSHGKMCFLNCSPRQF